MINRFSHDGQWKIIPSGSRKKVKSILNEGMGMKYRTKPYNLENENDLIEATKMAIGEYMDLAYFDMTVGDLVEETDECIELYRPDEWLAQDGIAETPDKTFTKAHQALEKALKHFRVLLRQLEMELNYLFEYILLEKNNHARVAFFGQELADKTPEALTCKFKQLFEDDMIYEAIINDYDGILDVNVDLFCRVLRGEYTTDESTGDTEG